MKQRYFSFLVVLCVCIPVVLSGCRGFKDTGTAPAQIIPNTQFGPLPVVPSVTAPVKAATTQAVDAEKAAAQVRVNADALTAENLAVAKPLLVSLATQAHESIRNVLAYLFAAQDRASQNDVAVADLTVRLETTQTLVKTREAEMKQMADNHQAGEAALRAQLAKLKNQLNDSNLKMAHWIFGSTVGVGVLLLIGGAIVVYLVIPRQLGITIAMVGGLCVMLGMAGLYYGQQIAIAGLAVGGVTMVAGAWAALRYLKQDGQSIAQGLQQAIIAGKVKLEDIRDHLDMAQTPGAKAMVNAEVK